VFSALALLERRAQRGGESHRNGVPVLAIAAQIPSAEIGSGYFQETHPESLFKDCSHSCLSVSTTEQMPRALETTMTRAIGQRGVVYNWFTEGFDTADLKDAKALLEELGDPGGATR